MNFKDESCPPLSLVTQYKFWAWVYKQNHRSKKASKK